ncbi:MAG: hypothetical protein PVI00_13520 [Desulfobacterales bacterium]
MLSTEVRKKSVGKMRSIRLMTVLLVPMVALIMDAAAPKVWAGGILFEETEFNIEYNFTDQDLGVRAFIDGDPWKKVIIVNPKRRTILAVKAIKSLSQQGLAELFFESGEPTLDEVPIGVFLNRFPEGTYKFFGIDVDGKFVHGRAEFTHDIPCAPEAEYDQDTRTISWLPVTNKIDNETGQCGEDTVTTEGYEVVVEGSDGEISITLPDDADSFVVPDEVGIVKKFEVLAIEESGNQTIGEVVVVEEPE